MRRQYAAQRKLVSGKANGRSLDSKKVLVCSRDGRQAVVSAGKTKQNILETLDAVAVMSRQQVACALGKSYSSVADAEEKALFKLRKHPELMRLWLRYKAEGGGAPLREEVGERLMTYQMEMARWYELVEVLGAAGKEKERAECLELIGQFHRKLGEILTMP